MTSALLLKILTVYIAMRNLLSILRERLTWFSFTLTTIWVRGFRVMIVLSTWLNTA